MRRGDVYWVPLDPTHGREQRERRPVVIVSPERFNRLTGAPVVLPLTTGGAFARRIGFAVAVEVNGLAGAVRCDQPRALDLAARGGEHAGRLSANHLDEVMAKVRTIFQ